MVKNTGWCVNLLSSQTNEKAFDKMFQMQIKAQSYMGLFHRRLGQVMVLLLTQVVRQQSYEEIFSGLQNALFSSCSFANFIEWCCPYFCICPFSVEVLDISSGNIYHCITSYSTDKAVHLFLPTLCSQGLQAFLRHPSEMCFWRKKKSHKPQILAFLYVFYSLKPNPKHFKISNCYHLRESCEVIRSLVSNL